MGTTRELAPTIAVIRLSHGGINTVLTRVVLDTTGLEHDLKGSTALALVWSVNAYTSGTWLATLQEGESRTGPFTAVPKRFYDWYVRGEKQAYTTAGVINPDGANKDYVLSYHGGLKRFLQLTIDPSGAGSLNFSVLALMGLSETMAKVFTDYDYGDLLEPVTPP